MPSPVKAIRKHLFVCPCFVCHVQHNQENGFSSNTYLQTLQFFTPPQNIDTVCILNPHVWEGIAKVIQLGISRANSLCAWVPSSHGAFVYCSLLCLVTVSRSCEASRLNTDLCSGCITKHTRKQ